MIVFGLEAEGFTLLTIDAELPGNFLNAAKGASKSPAI